MLGKVTFKSFPKNELSYLVTFYGKQSTTIHLRYFCIFKYEQGLIVFNISSSIYSKCKSPFTPNIVISKPQAVGRVNHVCTEEGSTLFSNKKQRSTIVSLSKVFLLISMVELDHQRSAANTLVRKMGLDTFVLFNIFNYCRFASYSEFVFNS